MNARGKIIANVNGGWWLISNATEMLCSSHFHFLNSIWLFDFLREGERSSNEYLYVFNRCLKTKREAVSVSAFFIAVCHVVQVKLAKIIFSFQQTNIASRGEHVITEKLLESQPCSTSGNLFLIWLSLVSFNIFSDIFWI